VAVTNTNNSANGVKTAVTASGFAVVIVSGSGHFNPNINYGFFRDERDEKIYRTVKIGEQTWMAENLNYAGAGGDIGICALENCAEEYGRVYNWAEAMNIDSKYNDSVWTGSDVKHQGLCPVGWHVPSKADFQILMGMDLRPPEPRLATSIRSQTGWAMASGINNTNESGFSALPIAGDIGDIGDKYAMWWSTNAELMFLSYGQIFVEAFASMEKKASSSVRCIKN
jgi:uncharacterized protein (TIGR02145 family)